MNDYLAEYAQMLMDKHGHGTLARLNDAALRQLVTTDLVGFAPEQSEIVGVSAAIRTLVGDDAPPCTMRQARARELLRR